MNAPRLPKFEHCLNFLTILGVTILVSYYLYMMAFRAFMWYDDEGYVMILQQGFNEGHALYEEVFSQYGPFPFVVRASIVQALPTVTWTHNTNRIISMSVYLLASSFFALAAFRLTRSKILLAVVLISCAHQAGIALSSEPGHPNDFVALLVAAMLLAATLEGRPRMRMALMGSVLGALIMTKINAGAFLFAAMCLTTVFLHRKSTALSKLLWITGCVAAVCLPIALMRLQLFDPALWSFSDESDGHRRNVLWLRFAIIQVSGMVAWLLVSRRSEDTQSDMRSAVRLHAAWVVPVGIVIAIHGVYLLARGTSLAGFVDGVFLRPISHPTVINAPIQYLDWYHPTIALAILLSVIGVTIAPRLLSTPLLLNAISLIKVAVGLGLLLRITQVGNIAPHDIYESTYGALSAAWACLLLFVPARENVREDICPPSFSIYFLGTATIMCPLYVYPISGSQALIVGMLVPVFASVLTYQGLTSLRRNLHIGKLITRNRVDSPALQSVAVIIVVLAFLVSTYHAGPFAEIIRIYQIRPAAKALRGADRLHLPRHQYAQYLALTQNLLAHTDRFQSLGGLDRSQLNSLYFWTNTTPPTYYNSTGYTLLRPHEMNAIWQALESSENPGVVTNQGPQWEGPLHDRLVENFQMVQWLGSYQIYLKKGRIPRRLHTWLLYGSRDFSEPDDVIPLLDGLLQSRPFTISMWFRTTEHGVLLGLQGGNPEGELESVSYVAAALYVGTDGILRCGLSQAPLHSATRLDDSRWHHCVLQVSTEVQTLYVDGVLSGTAQGTFPMNSLPIAQIGAGYWHGYPGSNDDEWSVFRGQIRDAILTRGFIASQELASLHGQAP